MHEDNEFKLSIILAKYSCCVMLSREEGRVQVRQSAAFVLLPYGIKITALLGELDGRVVGQTPGMGKWHSHFNRRGT